MYRYIGLPQRCPLQATSLTNPCSTRRVFRETPGLEPRFDNAGHFVTVTSADLSQGPRGPGSARISWTQPDFLDVNFDPPVPRGPVPEPPRTRNELISALTVITFLPQPLFHSKAYTTFSKHIAVLNYVNTSISDLEHHSFIHIIPTAEVLTFQYLMEY
ncbi:hypothetical protein TNCV_842831 [Trichonephila clavipes]|nr:hypothetical protein TNCV_842831 [Trichonephila clavipes]